MFEFWEFTKFYLNFIIFVLSFEKVVKSPNTAFKQLKGDKSSSDIKVINMDQEYNCHKIILLPIIHCLAKCTDNEKESVEFELPDKMHLLGDIINFCYGMDLVITESNCFQLYFLSCSLEVNMIQSAALEVTKAFINLENVAGYLNFIYNFNMRLTNRKNKISLEDPVDYNIFFEYIRNNFSLLYQQQAIVYLPIPILEELLSSDNLCITDENEIARYVLQILGLRGKEAAPLVDCLRLDLIDKDLILQLCETDVVDPKIILESTKRATQTTSSKRVYSMNSTQISNLIESGTKIEITNPPHDELDGIVAYLLEQKKTINIIPSSTKCQYFDARNLLNLHDEHTIWYSESEIDAHVIYDFYPALVRPTKYFLRTSGEPPGKGHLRSWRLLGSADRLTWERLDEQSGSIDLNGGYKGKLFEVATPGSGYFRYIKLQQTDRNQSDDFSMRLSCMELFGDVVLSK